jgi:nitrogen fixation protein FixH
MAPGSHATHHSTSGAVPADAAFQHIHSERGMADVMIEPGKVGTAQATIRLWNDDLEPLAAGKVTLTLTAPSPGSQPATHAATLNSDSAWTVGGVALSEPGNWTVTVDAALGRDKRLMLTAPIVIEPAP